MLLLDEDLDDYETTDFGLDATPIFDTHMHEKQSIMFAVCASSPEVPLCMPGTTQILAYKGGAIVRVIADQIEAWDALIASHEKRMGLLTVGFWVWEGRVETMESGSQETDRVRLVGPVRRATVADLDLFGMALRA